MEDQQAPESVSKTATSVALRRLHCPVEAACGRVSSIEQHVHALVLRGDSSIGPPE